jgi:hypothetical protein
MSSPHPNRTAAGPVRLVDPRYVAMSPAEESAALGALGRLLAWAAAPNRPRSLEAARPAARHLDDASAARLSQGRPERPPPWRATR